MFAVDLGTDVPVCQRPTQQFGSEVAGDGSVTMDTLLTALPGWTYEHIEHVVRTSRRKNRHFRFELLAGAPWWSSKRVRACPRFCTPWVTGGAPGFCTLWVTGGAPGVVPPGLYLACSLKTTVQA